MAFVIQIVCRKYEKDRKSKQCECIVFCHFLFQFFFDSLYTPCIQIAHQMKFPFEYFLFKEFMTRV